MAGAELANWRIRTGPDHFFRIAGPDGRIVRQADRASIGAKIALNLPGRAPTILRITGITETVPGVTTLEGVFDDDEGSVFTLALHDGKVFGDIRDRDYNWAIEPDGDSHRLRMIERRLIPRITDSDDGDDANDDKKLPDGGGHAKTGGSGRVDILFLYANNVSNAASLASNIVSNFNAALSASQVSSNNYVRSAGVQQVNHSFAGKKRSQILTLMKDRSAPFRDLMSEQMFHAKADIAFLLIQEDPSILDNLTYGRVGGLAHNFDANFPFALSTDDYAIGDYTALHEIGHVLNGLHEDEAATLRNRGKVITLATGDQWQTLMGGYKQCAFSGLPAACERIRYFSNPDVPYNGYSTGELKRDMESELESSMVAVSSWFNNGDPGAPASPASISKTNHYCYGDHTIDWADVVGADTYRLYESASSSFTSPTLIYTGAASDAGVMVSATRYYRARACGPGGCSGYSGQVSASYYNGCL